MLFGSATGALVDGRGRTIDRETRKGGQQGIHATREVARLI